MPHKKEKPRCLAADGAQTKLDLTKLSLHELARHVNYDRDAYKQALIDRITIHLDEACDYHIPEPFQTDTYKRALTVTFMVLCAFDHRKNFLDRLELLETFAKEAAATMRRCHAEFSRT